jgi:hypothetical protein
MKSTNPDQSPRDISLKCLTPRKLILSRFEKHVATAVAAAAIGAAAPASAAVVYSGVINFVCAVDIDGTYINVETNTLSNEAASGVPGWDVNPYSTSGGMNFFNSTGGGQMRRPGVTTGTAGDLDVGTVVGAAGSFNTGTGNVYGTTAATGLAGSWEYSEENTIGFRFVAGAGTTHYGWMRFLMGAAGSSGTSMTRTVVDYAWESTAGESITVTAGAVVTPDPDSNAVPEGGSTLALMGLVFAGLGLAHRKLS